MNSFDIIKEKTQPAAMKAIKLETPIESINYAVRGGKGYEEGKPSQAKSSQISALLVLIFTQLHNAVQLSPLLFPLALRSSINFD